jgi:5-methylcytosine-specific restriction endonuclease McrA
MTSRSTSSDQMSFHFGDADSAQSERTSQAETRCRFCRKPFEVPEWYLKKGVTLHFCSSECRDAWTQETPSFEVKLSKRAGHRGANWQTQAQKARQRDSFTCQVCGVTEEELGRQLDVHHKIPYRSFKSNVEANKLEHLLSVCPACHAHLEAQLQRELPLFRKA